VEALAQLSKRCDRIAAVALAGYVIAIITALVCAKQRDRIDDQQFRLDYLDGNVRDLNSAHMRLRGSLLAQEKAEKPAVKPPVKPRTPRATTRPPKLTSVK
jgi:hypothetical protein